MSLLCSKASSGFQPFLIQSQALQRGSWYLPHSQLSSLTSLFDIPRARACLRNCDRDNATGFSRDSCFLGTQEDAQEDDLSQPCVH